MRRVATAAVALLGLAGCHLLGRQPAPAPGLHYEIGQPYQADGVWQYPRAQFDLDETGLAVATTRTHGLTADGETADPTALAAAHPSLQLPAIARVTNLETGLQVLVRVNDRGPAQRGRAIALTPRAIDLLGGRGSPVLRVRIQVLEAESRQLARELSGAEGPALAVAAAPQSELKTETLAPPPGVQQEAARPLAAGPQPKPASAAASLAKIPLRLPEQVSRVPARPGALYVELAAFSRMEYAELLRQRLIELGAQTFSNYGAPRDRAFLVRVGPLATVAEADAVLGRTLQAGLQEARIVVE